MRRAGARTREALEESIAQALLTITAQDAHGWFQHCSYLPTSHESSLVHKSASPFSRPFSAEPNSGKLLLRAKFSGHLKPRCDMRCPKGRSAVQSHLVTQRSAHEEPVASSIKSERSASKSACPRGVSRDLSVCVGSEDWWYEGDVRRPTAGTKWLRGEQSAGPAMSARSQQLPWYRCRLQRGVD